jgi:flagellar basal-body rod modification protein FlgD
MSDAVSTVTSSTATTTTDTSSLLSSTIMEEEDFLKMLVTQMQYQDPLNPMESQEFASQLAQFSSVEQLTNINGNLAESLSVDLVLTQAINNTLSTTIIGKEAKGEGDFVMFNEDGEAQVSFELEDAAETVEISILDTNGNVVRTWSVENLSSGEHTLEWDLQNDHGETLNQGDYTFEVSAYDTSGNAIDATPYMIGTVTGIRYEDGAAIMLIDGKEIAFSAIQRVGA